MENTEVTQLSRREFLECACPGGQKPNFVFVLMDDMGWRDLACYGSTFTRRRILTASLARA